MTARTAQERFLERTMIDPATGCVLWTGARNPGGYGTFYMGGKTRLAHRLAYEMFVGPIPEGLQLDHLCRTRHCVSPACLEPVTSRENTMRGEGLAVINLQKTSCPSGHEYDEANTSFYRGMRYCRACDRERKRARYQRQRQAVAA